MLRVSPRKHFCVLPVLFLLTISAVAQNQGGKAAIDPAGIQRLQADTGGAARVNINPATGAVRFVRLPAGKAGDLAPASTRSARAQEKSMAFFRQYGAIFGITQPDTQLKEMARQSDRTGATHITYRQYYAGVPVFGGILKAHFDATNQLRSVNGTALPNVVVAPAPARSVGEAASTALSAVSEQKKDATGLVARRTQLYVFQAGLAKGMDLGTHLVWEVEISNGGSVREFVYVDAHNGKIVDQITGTPDNLYRRAYNGRGLKKVPPSYPVHPDWIEGDPFPTGVVEEDNMLYASFDTYYFYLHAFGRDSFDNAGAIMDQIFNRGYECPNASWNGIFISFCPGYTADDVTAHEWTHAYTEYTDGLIYQWQPGALNESYSDIFGETVDQINGRGTDTPNNARTAGACSRFSPPQVVVNVNSPTTATFPAQSAQFGPPLDQTGITGPVVYTTPADGCTAVSSSVQGKIALIDRGTCTFVIKVKNAQAAGAIGVIVTNNVAAGLPGMGGTDSTITIPSVGITQADGNTIKQLASVNVTLHASSAATDNSVRWLMGEDVTPGGAIRDMWNPACYSNPGKVTDYAYYVCDSSDGGGVHTNSGVPNHAYALLVDGGTYNGHTVAAIGRTKAAHIYYRAMSVYQVPSTDFADHADALEQSCNDLIGQHLNDLNTGAVSRQVIKPSDCAAVSDAIAAVQLRTPPAQCAFQPLLAKNPPALCAGMQTRVNIFKDDFETNPLGSWTVTHDAISPADFTLPDWEWANSIPDRKGSAFFVSDPDVGTCAPGGNEAGVRHLTSPVINVAAGSTPPLLAFQHWVGSETGWDGGNLWIRVNGGSWRMIGASDFTFNSYNLALNTAAAGNTNPLAGLPAFSGADGGSVSGSWGWSHVNLHSYLPDTAGVQPYTLQFRWDFGNDGCGGFVGWYLDDVTVYACRP